MERRRRTRPAVLIACAAAVPAMLLAGCSPGSGSGSDANSGSSSGANAGTGSTDSGSTGSASSTKGGSPTPTVAPARFATLPDPCKSVTKATVTALLPKAKSASGTEAKSSDIQTRGGCSWTGNGKDGYQYRWLSVTLERFASSTPLGAADDQAKKRFATEVAGLGKVPGFTTSPVTGRGDEASSVSGKATVSKVTSQNDTLVARTGNVVVIVEFNGAGLVGKKNPTAQTVQRGAQRAAKDVLAAVTAANA